jgi:hypothetical protein
MEGGRRLRGTATGAVPGARVETTARNRSTATTRRTAVPGVGDAWSKRSWRRYSSAGVIEGESGAVALLIDVVPLAAVSAEIGKAWK